MTERVLPTDGDQLPDLAHNLVAAPVEASEALAELARTVATKVGPPNLAVFSGGASSKLVVRSKLSRVAWGQLVSVRKIGLDMGEDGMELGLVILAPVGALKVVTGVGRPEILVSLAQEVGLPLTRYHVGWLTGDPHVAPIPSWITEPEIAADLLELQAHAAKPTAGGGDK